MTLSVALIVVTLVVSLLGPRRDLPPRDASGAVVVRAPVVMVGSLIGAWLVLLAAAAVWVFLMLTDFSRVDPAGPVVVVVLGSLGSLPYLARLLTGRLHRWEVRMTADALTYQGWRHSVCEPWSAVRGASVNQGRGPGVAVDLQGLPPRFPDPGDRVPGASTGAGRRDHGPGALSASHRSLL